MIVLLVALGVAIFAWWLHNERKYRSVEVPGPRSIPFLGCDLIFCKQTDLLRRMCEYADIYNGFLKVRLGPTRTVVVVSDYKSLEFILSSNKHIEKSLDYKFLYNWLGTGLLTGGGVKWKKHRKLITPAFHFGVLEESLPVFNSCSKKLAEKLKNEVGKDSFNIYPYVNLCSLDIICESAMGTQLNAQDQTDSEYVRCVKNMSLIVMARTFSPWKMYDFFYRFSKEYQTEKYSLSVLHGFTKEVIKRRRQEMGQARKEKQDEFGIKKRRAFLDLLLEASMTDGELTDDDIREEVDTFMFEGHDTVSTAICFTLHCLANNPLPQKKAYEEMEHIFSNDANRDCTMSDLLNMTYLEMVIKESLRLYPSVPFIAREFKEDIYFDGKFIPKHTTMTMLLFHAQRNPKVFPDPGKFDPERFSNDVQKAPYVYVPFSAGPRNCIGQKYAILEMKVVLANILRHYELLPAVPEHKLQLSSEVVLKSANGVHIKLTERK